MQNPPRGTRLPLAAQADGAGAEAHPPNVPYVQNHVIALKGRFVSVVP